MWLRGKWPKSCKQLHMNRTLSLKIAVWSCLADMSVDSFCTHCGSKSWTYWSFFPRETHLVCMCSWWFQPIWKMQSNWIISQARVQMNNLCSTTTYMYIYVYLDVENKLQSPPIHCNRRDISPASNSSCERGGWMTLQKEMLTAQL